MPQKPRRKPDLADTVDFNAVLPVPRRYEPPSAIDRLLNDKGPQVVPRHQTTAESTQEKLERAFGSLIPQSSARKLSHTLMGGMDSGLPAEMGLVDFVPYLGSAKGIESAAQDVQESKRHFDEGDYGDAALSYLAASLGLIPLAAGMKGTIRNAGRAMKGVKDFATSDAAYNMMNKVASATGAAPMNIMMGPTSKTWNKTAAELAKQMEREGKSRNEIWQATKTFRAPDGQLRQEIPDAAMKYDAGPVEEKQFNRAKKRYEQSKALATTPEELDAANDYWNRTKVDSIFNLTGKAEDFVNHPELFAAYPDLAEIPFKQLGADHNQFTAPASTQGMFKPLNNTIILNTDAQDRRSTALHELQHAIQKAEGWQGGSSPEYISAKMSERGIAKQEAKEIQDRIDNMRSIDPVLYEDLIKDEQAALGQRQYILNQTKQLEGEADPYDAYRKVSGEEEARMVQARRDYPEEKLAERPPFLDYEARPDQHITGDFAAGGAVMMAGGGFLEMMAKAAKQGVTRGQRMAMSNRDVARRIPALEEAILALEKGEITKQQYAQLVQAYKPVEPYETFFKPESDEKIVAALTKTNREKAGTPPKQSYFGVPSSALKRGDPAATRQDIPSYTDADTWVVTAHQPQQGKKVYAGAGPRIGYEPVAMLNDVKFEVQPNAAMKIAKGGQKGTIATMEGFWEPITRELAEEMGPDLMRDPRWVQAGMDPTRSASFYDRKTMQPILEGEQVLHSGPLVLVKNPRYGDIEDFPFKEGGEVHMSKGGALKNGIELVDNFLKELNKPTALKVKPPSDNIAVVKSANFDYPKVIGNQTLKVNDVSGGVRMSDPHERKRVQALAQKMSSPNGYISRIIVDHKNNVIEGQHRLEALRHLGIEDVPVYKIEDLSDTMPVASMESALNAVAPIHPDHVNQLIGHALEDISEHGIDHARTLDYGKYQKFYDAALDAAFPDITKATGGEVHMGKGGALKKGLSAVEEFLAHLNPATKAIPKAAQEILPAAEREANLAKFLEGSAAQNRLYHGTRTSFNEFKHGEGKDTDFGRFGRGYYFTPDPDLASAYARNEAGGNVMPVFLSLKNPYMFKGSESQELLRKLGGGPEPKNLSSEEGKKWADSVRKGLEAMGHDGYMDATDSKYAKEIVAFRPEQIKSATGNRGTYDIADPDINKAGGGDISIDDFLNSLKAK